MARLFGTDGVRGVANADLTPELAFRLGRAHASRTLGCGRPRLVVGKDTRLSSDMLEAAYVSGACSVGADVLCAGVLPTPGVAWLIGRYAAQGGAMISASHNPAPDNGIKLFDSRGFKLPDEEEEQIESLLEGPDRLPRPTGEGLGRPLHLEEEAREQYLEFVAANAGSLAGLKVVLDCAHGAAYLAGPQLFRRLGAEVVVLHDQPDGSNINRGCGSTHPAALQEAVRGLEADLGLAFDGDADRCLAVDSRGRLVDGDPMLLIFANWLKEAGRLNGHLVVATVMSNFGLEEALRRRGIEMARAPVGDRYVLAEMLARGGVLGGEQSGHIIFLDRNTTGDGLLTGALLASIVAASGRGLHELAADLERRPQKLVNVPARHKDRLSQDEEIAAAVARVEERLRHRGRVLVRPSGTEPLVRVMAEGPDAGELDEVISQLSQIIQERLG
jgi:phosphoglucosamine mutase